MGATGSRCRTAFASRCSKSGGWRFARRITAEDLAEMLREAVFRRFGAARARAQGIEFLSDNGPEYVRAMGLIPCHTPRRSPESNGLAEAFFGSFKRDYVY